MTNIRTGEWMSATRASLGELASEALGGLAVGGDDGGPVSTTRRLGAYVPLVGKDVSVHIGVSTDSPGCEALGRALLAMGADEDFESDEDVLDAVGEIANMLAGGVKKRMADRQPGLQMGLPLLVEGSPQRRDRAEIAHADLRVGDVHATIFVVLAPAQ